ncbi:CGNR zinc finger domain-containing protein [Streptomyces europaeiscabiei]|uniref:CGNR zinc finger domain-containing protein n=1 Tax=Streptomyces europaeiscabiei TaxID=146819 RepID=UPI00099BFBEB|nr:ABATE domain-containing protein [Streptomyces europaeiscabiei]MDX2757518.1 ABATE domain-containing protein [Streptomyces europaeiscabiei]MDX2757573.1 ABATE domain-containing protein [Streptomyces europaeiscabiei]MDX2766762.1 ABATE domain-containing protein [Streptomyces europaeiscabiei]MDX3665626.1 ABATE domain-containing protein [Streptomyces europaeiscabiei]MDX3713903.1 ABATE domain-containing protein [Streptomyces europaeiscabiei]
MEYSISTDARLALDLALTVRHDGDGGVTDDLTDPMGLATWIRAHADVLPAVAGPAADEAALTAVRDLRGAVRALFARAVSPGEPSPADAARLLPVPEALERLNEAAALAPTVPVLTWGPGAEPVVRHEPATGEDPLTAVLARAALAFLASPERQRLRACHAPRCVRYFLKEHPRQEWCRPSCGNRARVARHHERHKRTAS